MVCEKQRFIMDELHKLGFEEVTIPAASILVGTLEKYAEHVISEAEKLARDRGLEKPTLEIVRSVCESMSKRLHL